ncbi:hypothetical protein ME121_6444 [Methylobacterium sp. ME121]|nr:hypothetical protein ME121_6444 [Methylobacterium sp. ME121]
MAPRHRAGMDAEAVARLMAAQDQEEGSPAEPVSIPAAAPAAPPAPTRDPGFDPGKVDGRTLRRTGREPFATRIKPEAHEALKRIAYARGITIAEALEMAVAAFSER